MTTNLKLFCAIVFSYIGLGFISTAVYADEHETPVEAAVEEEAIAEDEEDWFINGYVSLASEYNFRGLTLSARQPALQHSLTASHASGAYFGYWISNANGERRGRYQDTESEDPSESLQQALELDIYAGLYYDVSDDFYIDIFGNFYTYNFVGGSPNSDLEESSGNLNYIEYFVVLGFLGGDLTMTVAYSPEYFGYSTDLESTYVQLAYGGEIADNLALRVSVGNTTLSGELTAGESFGPITSIIDYKLALAVTWNDGTDEIEFAYVGVDKNGKDYYLGYFEYEEYFYEDRLMLTLTKGF